jgi:hypothetical protein
MWGLWWAKRHWGRFSPSTSVSLANHTTDFSIIIITRGWHNRPLSGRSVEWTLIPPPTMQIKKKVEYMWRKSTVDHWRSRCKGWILRPSPYTYICDENIPLQSPSWLLIAVHTYVTHGSIICIWITVVNSVPTPKKIHCISTTAMFILKITWNKEIRPVVKMMSFRMLRQAQHRCAFKWIFKSQRVLHVLLASKLRISVFSHNLQWGKKRKVFCVLN